VTDTDHMRRAIRLAQSRVGLTGANPSVGCVIVKDGVVAGEAATAEGGRPHAEEQALAQAAEKAKGATAYVTLEPCGARSNGGLSCATRLAQAGITQVVIACEDASYLASGQGIEVLREAGVAVRTGMLTDEAQPLYSGYSPRS